MYPRAARAEPSRESPQTFEYTTEIEKNYLRAVLELEALTTVSVIWYVIDVRNGRDTGYRWQIFERKLSGSALALDDNAFGTNFHGHGVGGNAYYLSARGNHLNIAESFGFAIAGALLWEYFGEVSEVVSVNDVIVTPLSGITIGEPFTQLGAFFDRQRPTTLNRVLGSVFGPIKSVNDALDGVTLRRSSGPDDEWHRFVLAGSVATVRERVANPNSLQYRDEVRLELSERLARLRDYDGSTDRSEWFNDGNVSGLSLNLSFGPRGLKDLAFASDLVPFGYFERRARRTPGGIRGSGFVVGWAMGYRYLLHDYGGVPQSSLDRAAFVQPIGVMFEYRARMGSFSLAAKADATGAFGGIHPIALDAAASDRDSLRYTLRSHGYYFGVGGQLQAGLTLAYRDLEASASFTGRRFTRVDQRLGLTVYDAWERFQFGFGYRMRPNWTLRLFSDDMVRTGRLGDAWGRAHDSTAGLEARVDF